ncbi:MAG TPA: ABC transporter permease, partial [Stellaceae bacterium]|nr:ABC transporter permease [Stellaceae bacterium]
MAPKLTLGSRGDGTMVLQLAGDWKLAHGLPTTAPLEQRFASAAQPSRVTLDASGLASWDSGLLAFLTGLVELCRERKIELDPGNLPDGARRLMKLATAVPERQGARRTEKRESFLTLVGKESLALWKGGGEMLSFLGEAVLSLLRLFVGRARFRFSDLIDIIYDCGAAALPIVTLISFLVGLILAFVGAVQLQQFGAQIYVADLVGIAMAREMGALMTAIIMSGRTGAAFAAQLGTMQVNEEIDALSTFGLSPMDFLVLPRMIALILMMPLLAVYAN